MAVFFSSRRRHTRLVSDWSSDVCSSDLWDNLLQLVARVAPKLAEDLAGHTEHLLLVHPGLIARYRSEERRVGKECRSLGSPDHVLKNQRHDIVLYHAVRRISTHVGRGAH